MRVCIPRYETTRERRQHSHPGGGGHEVLHGQPHHLREIAERRLSGIVLPVRIGGEADRDIESGMRFDAGKPLRIPRQEMLQTQQRIDGKKSGSIESEKCERVLAPRHRSGGIDAGKPVEPTFAGPVDRPS